MSSNSSSPVANNPVNNWWYTNIEYSQICQALTYIPILGQIPEFLAGMSIGEKLKKLDSKDCERFIQLVSYTNAFETGAVGRSVLTLAGIIALFARGLITMQLTVMGSVGSVAAAGYYVYAIYQNTQQIKMTAVTGQFDRTSVM